jgi:hypothetical protein
MSRKKRKKTKLVCIRNESMYVIEIWIAACGSTVWRIYCYGNSLYVDGVLSQYWMYFSLNYKVQAFYYIYLISQLTEKHTEEKYFKASFVLYLLDLINQKTSNYSHLSMSAAWKIYHYRLIKSLSSHEENNGNKCGIVRKQTIVNFFLWKEWASRMTGTLNLH